MDLTRLKQKIQGHFTDGLVTIVGSGLSVAEGIPGMGGLANHLLDRIPSRLTSPSATWNKIAQRLDNGDDLETAMLSDPPDQTLEHLIVEETAALIQSAETRIIESVIDGRVHLRFSRLLRHLVKPKGGIPIITTNYDRLIELAVEVEGLGLNSLFVGAYVARLSPDESRYSLCRGVRLVKREVVRTYADHALVLKPHGSLDWYMRGGVPVRCAGYLSRPLIITPGLNKYMNGYYNPFDTHRNRANTEIDKADKFLIVGYGFNDDHLQTRLLPRIQSGIPTLILTRSLSTKAQAVVNSSPTVIALTCAPDGSGTIVTTQGGSATYASSSMWDLGGVIEEVLEP